VPRTTSVRIVLPAGRAPQICPTIVACISIAMIDRWFTPPAGHVEPRQLMCGVEALINGDKAATLLGGGMTGRKVTADTSATALAPAKFSGLLVVIQQLAQARARQARTFFHGRSRK